MEGQLVRLRLHTTLDAHQDLVRADNDPELGILDPSAGKVSLIVLCAIDTLDNYYIGTCGLYNLEGTRIQTGIRINDRNYWGKGYGTEAMKLLVDYGFTLMPGISCIWLKVLPENVRAIGCYMKCGFVQSGTLSLNGYEFITMEAVR